MKDNNVMTDFADQIRQQAGENAVFVTANKFERHPAAYNPRVFVKVMSFSPEDVTAHWYELLDDGNAIPWTARPTGFDYWEIEGQDDFKNKPFGAITMRRQGALEF